MNNCIEEPKDFAKLYVGQMVFLVGHPSARFCIISTRYIRTEDREIPNPVMLVTVDKEGRPHTLTVSAYCIIY